jgi:hypothetical protein
MYFRENAVSRPGRAKNGSKYVQYNPLHKKPSDFSEGFCVLLLTNHGCKHAIEIYLLTERLFIIMPLIKP